MTLARRIKELRATHHLTQAELADAIGVNASYIGLIETGKRERPSKEIIINLAHVLETPVDDLLAAAGYTLIRGHVFDLANPKWEFYLQRIADMMPEDQDIILDIIVPAVEALQREEREARRHRREQRT